jgi:hypothetical protein
MHENPNVYREKGGFFLKKNFKYGKNSLKPTK